MKIWTLKITTPYGPYKLHLFSGPEIKCKKCIKNFGIATVNTGGYFNALEKVIYLQNVQDWRTYLFHEIFELVTLLNNGRWSNDEERGEYMFMFSHHIYSEIIRIAVNMYEQIKTTILKNFSEGVCGLLTPRTEKYLIHECL